VADFRQEIDHDHACIGVGQQPLLKAIDALVALGPFGIHVKIIRPRRLIVAQNRSTPILDAALIAFQIEE
jgi:hypothetical protein